MKYFYKKLSDFQEGDSVLMSGDTVFVISKSQTDNTVNLVLSGGFNHIGEKNSTLLTYGTPKRTRRTKQQMQEAREIEEELKNYSSLVEEKYQKFIQEREIKDNINYFQLIDVDQIKIGDIIKRGKKYKSEEVVDIIDLGTKIRIVGFMGLENDERYGLDIEDKDSFIYRYSSE